MREATVDEEEEVDGNELRVGGQDTFARFAGRPLALPWLSGGEADVAVIGPDEAVEDCDVGGKSSRRDVLVVLSLCTEASREGCDTGIGDLLDEDADAGARSIDGESIRRFGLPITPLKHLNDFTPNNCSSDL